jgi:cysteine desulfurase family protein (TIGR01976 family)
MAPFPIDAVRGEFPALAPDGDDDGASRIYLDNPAGTQVPRRVIEAVSGAFVEAASNLGGPFPNSAAADRIWAEAHQAMADLLGAASAREIVVGPSMTNLTFHLSRSIGALLEPGDEIIVTRMDHEGDVAPWLHLAEDRDLVIKWLPFDRETWRIERVDLEAALSERTRLLALNYASNLTGSINDVRDLTAAAKAAGAWVYVDAVQFAPHGLIDVAALGCDFLVCSSYKFFGPHLGVLWGRGDLLEALPAYKCRCASDAIPEKFETGTPQTELLAGLTACADYLAWIGGSVGASGDRRARIAAAFEAIGAYEDSLTQALIDGIGTIAGATIHGITNSNRIAERVPTVSLTHDRVDPPRLAAALAEEGICAWAGHNYALEVVRHLGIDEQQGVLRLGLAHYNTRDEVERTLNVLERIMA